MKLGIDYTKAERVSIVGLVSTEYGRSTVLFMASIDCERDASISVTSTGFIDTDNTSGDKLAGSFMPESIACVEENTRRSTAGSS
jgi:hypothetical protein